MLEDDKGFIHNLQATCYTPPPLGKHGPICKYALSNSWLLDLTALLPAGLKSDSDCQNLPKQELINRSQLNLLRS